MSIFKGDWGKMQDTLTRMNGEKDIEGVRELRRNLVSELYARRDYVDGMDYQIDDMALAACEKMVEEWEDFEPYHGPQVMTKKPTVSIPISAIGNGENRQDQDQGCDQVSIELRDIYDRAGGEGYGIIEGQTFMKWEKKEGDEIVFLANKCWGAIQLRTISKYSSRSPIALLTAEEVRTLAQHLITLADELDQRRSKTAQRERLNGMLIMPLLDLLLLSCGTWYLSECLVSKEGPFKVFTWMRDHLPHGGLLNCIYCTALWVGLALYLLHTLGNFPYVGQVLGVVGIALMLRSYTGVQHG